MMNLDTKLAVGTTLLACCQSANGLLCFQIGDGDIAWMSNDNNVHFIFSEPDDTWNSYTFIVVHLRKGLKSTLIPNQ